MIKKLILYLFLHGLILSLMSLPLHAKGLQVNLARPNPNGFP